ncbi:type VII secretion integral membrane protein EccD [Mycobacterium xenopi]|uniref:type VII secretion integral membrane protein EccD n=1 Tax=Mycobacterium xenopi TaxID=1789 RepID=UPI001ED90D05|nr:type VII secretion integral membrane protein EccD [Mycobacterium xenopi]
MSEASLCRVSVHLDGVNVDLALPAAQPIATLIPPIVDMVGASDDGHSPTTAVRYQLSRVGGPVMSSSKTLAQCGIRDGTVLVLTRSAAELPPPRFDDAAQAAACTLTEAARSWTRQASRLSAALTAGWLAGIGALALVHTALTTDDAQRSRIAAGVAALVGCAALLAAAIASRVYRDRIAALTLGLISTGFAAAAGLLAVPSGPAAPNLLLAAAAAAAAAGLALRLTGCGIVTFTAAACCAVSCAVAALAGVITAAPRPAIAAALAVASLALLELSPRLSIAVTGLSPRLPAHDDDGASGAAPDRLSDRAIRANGWLTSLVAALSVSAATGAVIAVHDVGEMPVARIAFAALTAAVLLSRARSDVDLVRTLILVVNGIAALTAAFVAAAAAAPRLGWITATTAMLIAAALYLGFAAPSVTVSPVARRSVEVVEHLTLTAIVPLACWLCGLYSAVRGLSLP